MNSWLVYARSSKGQMKMQQMAFMLVALMVFFGMVTLVFVSLTTSSISRKADDLKVRDAKESLRKIVGSPEVSFTSGGDCSSCVDFDKILLLKEFQSYRNFWNFDYLMVERIYPKFDDIECTKQNYPKCSRITVVPSEEDIVTQTAFVAIVYWDKETESFKYELGRIHVSAKA